jgi:hypothetical protein
MNKHIPTTILTAAVIIMAVLGAVQGQHLRQMTADYATLTDRVAALERHKPHTVYTMTTEEIPEAAEVTEAIQQAYDYDEVCRIITAEAGHDRELCYAVAQCLYNACALNDWRTTPLETARMYQYAPPTCWASDEAVEAVVAIFDAGERYDPVGNATLFYNPLYCDSEYHESNLLTCELHGVRFFEEAELIP